MGGVPEAPGGRKARSDGARQHPAAQAREPAVTAPSAFGASAAGLRRRVAATVYEAFIIAALLLAVGFALLPVVTPARWPGAASRSLYVMSPGARAVSAAASLAACAVYCASFWSGGRRTLAMKTWRLAMRGKDGAPVGLPRAALRYLACWAGPALAILCVVALQPFGHERWAAALLAFNYAWAIVDPDRQFLQDRLAGTRLVMEPCPRRPSRAAGEHAP